MHSLIVVLKNSDGSNDDAVVRLEDDLSSLQLIDPCADYICGREDDEDFDSNLERCREVMQPLGFEFNGRKIIINKEKILARYTANIDNAVIALKVERTTSSLYNVEKSINAGIPIYDCGISSALDFALSLGNCEVEIDYFIDYHS